MLNPIQTQFKMLSQKNKNKKLLVMSIHRSSDAHHHVGSHHHSRGHSSHRSSTPSHRERTARSVSRAYRSSAHHDPRDYRQARAESRRHAVEHYTPSYRRHSPQLTDSRDRVSAASTRHISPNHSPSRRDRVTAFPKLPHTAPHALTTPTLLVAIDEVPPLLIAIEEVPHAQPHQGDLQAVAFPVR